MLDTLEVRSPDVRKGVRRCVSPPQSFFTLSFSAEALHDGVARSRSIWTFRQCPIHFAKALGTLNFFFSVGAVEETRVVAWALINCFKTKEEKENE